MILRLLLAGDVMTGRGIDQILAHAGDPALREESAASALEYVALAERAHGAIQRPVDDAYVWGDALSVLERLRPDARIVNLETAVTRSERRWMPKEIHYRMHPDNVACLTAARLDCCVLANNHVLDFDREGLVETVEVLARAGIKTAGAGRDAAQAWQPAAIEVAGDGRVIVLAIGSDTSGIPTGWAATASRPGVARVEGFGSEAVARIGAQLASVKRAGDVTVVSVHWGSNWGYDVSDAYVRFAHELVHAGADVVHGHSSHHPRAIELFEGKLILYGCGDLVNDYEGISGHEQFRSDLGLLYLASVEAGSGRLDDLRMVPLRMRRLRLARASAEEAGWLRDVLDRESRRFGVAVELIREDGPELRASASVNH